jgi:hypothetical protein
MEASHGGDRLPYDLLVDILGRLQGGDLALSRRVCRAWRDAVDDGALLLPHFHRIFPPRAFPGIFTSNYGIDENSSFFTPPWPWVVVRRRSGAAASGILSSGTTGPP